MEYGAIDLHKKESQVRIITESGEVIDRRIPTTRERLTTVLGPPAPRILVEASTESEWVAQHLETLGHEVVVADPNYAADVWPPEPAREDRSARCGGPHGGVSPWDLSSGPSPIGAPAEVQWRLNIRQELTRRARERFPSRAPSHGAPAIGFAAARPRPFYAPGGAGLPAHADDPGAAAQCHRDPQRRTGQRRDAVSALVGRDRWSSD